MRVYDIVSWAGFFITVYGLFAPMPAQLRLMFLVVGIAFAAGGYIAKRKSSKSG